MNYRLVGERGLEMVRHPILFSAFYIIVLILLRSGFQRVKDIHLVRFCTEVHMRTGGGILTWALIGTCRPDHMVFLKLSLHAKNQVGDYMDCRISVLHSMSDIVAYCTAFAPVSRCPACSALVTFVSPAAFDERTIAKLTIPRESSNSLSVFTASSLLGGPNMPGIMPVLLNENSVWSRSVRVRSRRLNLLLQLHNFAESSDETVEGVLCSDDVTDRSLCLMLPKDCIPKITYLMWFGAEVWRTLRSHPLNNGNQLRQSVRESAEFILGHNTFDTKRAELSIYLELSRVTVKLSDHHQCHLIEWHQVRCIVEEESSSRAIQDIYKVLSLLRRRKTMLSGTNTVVPECHFNRLSQSTSRTVVLEMLQHVVCLPCVFSI